MRRRFFWSIAGVAGLTIASLVLVGAIASRRAQTNAAAQSLSAVTQSIADELRTLESEAPNGTFADLVTGAGVRRVLEQARRSTNTDIGLIIRTPRRTMVAAAFIEELDVPADEIDVGAVETFRVLAGVAVARSVEIERFNGDVVIVAAQRSPVIAWRDQLRTVIFGVVVAAIIAAIAARLLSGWVTRRIDPLIAGAASLSEGDLSTRVAVEGADELAGVAESFNVMAEALETSRSRERQFLLSVGHDLRTPLTTIAGYAEALEDGIDDPAEVARIAGVMTTENRRLKRLIEDVMLLARIDSAEFGVVSEAVDAGAHIKGLVDGYRDRAEREGVSIDMEAAPTGLRHVDPDRVGQILSNLLENALRYTPVGGTVSVRMTESGDAVTLVVADTGTGIEADDLPRIFERFYVAQKYRGVRPEGSGLGLSIVERIVTTMGGSITATSEPGSGTTFTVSLPAPRV